MLGSWMFWSVSQWVLGQGLREARSRSFLAVRLGSHLCFRGLLCVSDLHCVVNLHDCAYTVTSGMTRADDYPRWMRKLRCRGQLEYGNGQREKQRIGRKRPWMQKSVYTSHTHVYYNALHACYAIFLGMIGWPIYSATKFRGVACLP